MRILGLVVLMVWGLHLGVGGQDAKQIIQKASDHLNGETSRGELTMRIIRPAWDRQIGIKSWTSGTDFSLILITSPARDEGTAFLKREKELWNWQPTIDRVIKLPPSMMLQSWMGSDFTNDDLVRQSSTVDDYTHQILQEEEIEGRICYKIELTPLPEAPVVWGKVISWIDQTEYLTMKTEFYDEDGYLVNTMFGKNVTVLGGKTLPALLEIVPADEDGNKTVIEYIDLVFDEPIEEEFFSVRNMKRIQ